MAKIGEADSRWIVAARTDGKNVDNWHWNEKDLYPWTKEHLQSSLKNLTVPSTNPNIVALTIEKTDNVDGTAIVCNRKAKIIYVFDITLTLKWNGKVKQEDGTEVEGKGIILVEEISNTEDKWKIVVKMDDETAKNRVLKAEMQSSVGGVINKLIDDTLEGMKKQGAPVQDVSDVKVITPSAPVRVGSSTPSSSPSPAPSPSPAIHTSTSTPTATPPPSPSPSPSSSSTSSSTPSSSPSPAPSSSSPSPATIRTKSLSQTITFEVAPQRLYDTLLDTGIMSALSGSPAKIEAKVNSQFSLFDGTVSGKIMELTPPKKIVQKWRVKNWPENHFSSVTMTFEAAIGDKAVLTLTQTGVPDSDFDRTRDGWESYFWQRLRGLFGWNYTLKQL